MHSSIIQSWTGKNVIVIGDIMLDRYLFGSTNRISPEAPVPIVDLEEQQDKLGGAANVALNIQSLGANPILIGVVGKDQPASIIHQLLEEDGLKSSGILHDTDRPTTLKSRIWSAGKQILRLDHESKEFINELITTELIGLLISEIQQQSIDAIILQDYNKGLLTPDFIQAIITIAQKHQIPVIVDPKDDQFFHYQSVNLFKPNLKEIRNKMDFDINPRDIESLDRADSELRKLLNHQITMITLSEHGLYINDGQQSCIYPTQSHHIIDVCGAGDSVLSVCALCLITLTGMDEMAILSNLAGGLVCQQTGVVQITAQQLQHQYHIHKKKIGS